MRAKNKVIQPCPVCKRMPIVSSTKNDLFETIHCSGSVFHRHTEIKAVGAKDGFYGLHESSVWRWNNLCKHWKEVSQSLSFLI